MVEKRQARIDERISADLFEGNEAEVLVGKRLRIRETRFFVASQRYERTSDAVAILPVSKLQDAAFNKTNEYRKTVREPSCFSLVPLAV